MSVHGSRSSREVAERAASQRSCRLHTGSQGPTDATLEKIKLPENKTPIGTMVFM